LFTSSFVSFEKVVRSPLEPAIVREAVLETLSELLERDDEGELNEVFVERIRASMSDASPRIPAEEVAKRLGLTW